MNNQLRGLLYYFGTHMKRAFLIFWSILLGITIITLVAAYILRNEDGVMTFTFWIPMYFFCAIYGFTIVKKCIPYFLKIGATRKNIFLGVGIFFSTVSATFALLAAIFQSIANLFVKQLNIDILSFIHIAMVYEDTWYNRWLIDFILMLVCFTFLFLLGLLFYKYGLLISGIVMGIVFFGLIFSAFKGWMATFFQYIVNLDFHFIWQLALLAIILYGLSWLFLRKITTVRA